MGGIGSGGRFFIVVGEFSDINFCIFESSFVLFVYCSVRYSFMGFDVVDE